MTLEAGRLARGKISLSVLVIATLVLVAGAYQVRTPLEIDLGSAAASAPFVVDFHDAEGSFRWSRARSCIVFPDVGAGVSGRVELELSAYRPRGVDMPLVVVEAGATQEQRTLARGLQTVSLPLTSRGVWTSDVTACVRSETFQPGANDERQLGVRVHRARWVPAAGPTLPPLRQLLLSVLTVLWVVGIASRAGLSHRHALAAGVVGTVALALAYGWARLFAVEAALPLAVATLSAYAVSRFFPSFASLVVHLTSLSGRRWWRGLRMAAGWPTAVLALAGAVALTGVYWARPTLNIDLGSGREASRAHRFASFDSESGVRFRRALQGAELDLRDFGGGDRWRIAVTGSLPEGGHRKLPLVRVGGVDANAGLSDGWTTVEIEAESPAGWDSGLVLEFPVSGALVDRVTIGRGRSLPSVRILLTTVGAAVFFSILGGAAGLGRGPAAFAAAAFLAFAMAVFYFDPVLAIPLASLLLGICALATVVAALTGGLLDRMASRQPHVEVGAAIATTMTISVGFVVWLTAMSAPLYHGLHFVYHSNIAEEIWKGNFLVFYLPHPNNILSREAQWGGLLVPYSCLYHTLIAPLAALPAFWSQLTQKIFQAGLLAATALIGSMGAWKLASGKSGWLTALLLVSLPTTFQLLGLAHFVTIFGIWASSLAIVYLIASWGTLDRRGVWWGAVALLTLAFLSYTASLLFTAFTVAVASILLVRVDRRQSLHLATAGVAAAAGALVLYYMHWVIPFVRESIPMLFASEGAEPTPVGVRLAAIPRKLGYSFGSVLLPLAGLAGVAFLTWRSRERARWILLGWASVLVFFSGADIFFNFILKHHYFTIVPAALGTAVLIDAADARGGWAKWAAWGIVVYAVVLGARAALALATGMIE